MLLVDYRLITNTMWSNQLGIDNQYNVKLQLLY